MQFKQYIYSGNRLVNSQISNFMKNLFLGLVVLSIMASCTNGSKENNAGDDCKYNKDSMVVVMRFERKILPENIAFYKSSFDACKAEVMAKEPGCLNYSLFQSYNDSTMFCLTEAWANKGAHNEHMRLEHTIKHIAETKGMADPAFKSITNYTYWICPGANEKK